jgi:hypothetical protein
MGCVGGPLSKKHTKALQNRYGAARLLGYFRGQIKNSSPTIPAEFWVGYFFVSRLKTKKESNTLLKNLIFQSVF